jgi:hypothetical protein
VRYIDPTGHYIPGIDDCQPIWMIVQGQNIHDFQQYSVVVIESLDSLGVLEPRLTRQLLDLDSGACRRFHHRAQCRSNQDVRGYQRSCNRRIRLPTGAYLRIRPVGNRKRLKKTR